jgi:hypothetical protein
MKWLLARLSEPSTWAGIALFAQNVIPAAQSHSTAAIVGAVLGTLATVVPEKTAA